MVIDHLPALMILTIALRISSLALLQLQWLVTHPISNILARLNVFAALRLFFEFRVTRWAGTLCDHSSDYWHRIPIVSSLMYGRCHDCRRPNIFMLGQLYGSVDDQRWRVAHSAPPSGYEFMDWDLLRVTIVYRTWFLLLLLLLLHCVLSQRWHYIII